MQCIEQHIKYYSYCYEYETQVFCHISNICNNICGLIKSERCERSTYYKSYMGHLDENQTALKHIR